MLLVLFAISLLLILVSCCLFANNLFAGLIDLGWFFCYVWCLRCVFGFVRVVGMSLAVGFVVYWYVVFCLVFTLYAVDLLVWIVGLLVLRFWFCDFCYFVFVIAGFYLAVGF